MRIVKDNRNKEIEITCDCGAELSIGIDDVESGWFSSKYIVCPVCKHKIHLRSDIKKCIAMHGKGE